MQLLSNIFDNGPFSRGVSQGMKALTNKKTNFGNTGRIQLKVDMYSLHLPIDHPLPPLLNSGITSSFPFPNRSNLSLHAMHEHSCLPSTTRG